MTTEVNSFNNIYFLVAFHPFRNKKIEFFGEKGFKGKSVHRQRPGDMMFSQLINNILVRRREFRNDNSFCFNDLCESVIAMPESKDKSPGLADIAQKIHGENIIIIPLPERYDPHPSWVTVRGNKTFELIK